MGGDRLDRGEDRLHGGDVAGLDLAQLAASARAVGGSTEFTLSGKSTITVVGVTGVTSAWFG